MEKNVLKSHMNKIADGRIDQDGRVSGRVLGDFEVSRGDFRGDGVVNGRNKLNESDLKMIEI